MANDHYISQFYLKNFAIAGRSAFIWSYVRNGSPKDRPIKKVASAEDFYTIDTGSSGVDARELDRQLQIVETNAAPLIARLLTTNLVTLTPQDKEWIAYFFGVLADRTPFQRDQLQSLDAHMKIKSVELLAKNDFMFNEFLKSIPEGEQEEYLTQRETLKEVSKHVKIEYKDQKQAHQYFLGLALATAEALADILLAKHWVLLETTSSRVFVTSDNPLVLLPPENYPTSMGLGFIQATVLIPLSPQRCLLMGNTESKSDFIKINRAQTIMLNERIILAAHKYVYSNISSKDTQKIFDRTEYGHNLRIYT